MIYRKRVILNQRNRPRIDAGISRDLDHGDRRPHPDHPPPSRLLALTEFPRALAEFGTLFPAAPVLASAPRRRRSPGAGAAGLRHHRPLDRGAAALPDPAGLRRAYLGSRPQPGAEGDQVRGEKLVERPGPAATTRPGGRSASSAGRWAA
ncbi:hypothetical protein AB5I41_01765 [Sphingomonas sp. MMS24-JH45]